MKTIIISILLMLFSAEAMAQYPVYKNRSSVQYGYRRGCNTYYFNGGRQPAYWSHSNRNYGVPQTHYFRGNRRISSVYGW